MKLGFLPISGKTCAAGDEGEYACERHDTERVIMRRGDDYPLCRIENRIVQWIRVETTDEPASSR